MNKENTELPKVVVGNKPDFEKVTDEEHMKEFERRINDLKVFESSALKNEGFLEPFNCVIDKILIINRILY